jgi:hypothetical protein
MGLMGTSKVTSQTFDLSKLNTAKSSEEGSVLEVLHPIENTKLGIRIRLAGQDSEVYRKVTNKIANKRVKQLSPGRPSMTFTVEEQESNAVIILVACTLGWEGIVMNGQEYPFNPDNAKTLYSDPGFSWLREQVDKFIADRANFLAC